MRHHQVQVGSSSLHVVEAGDPHADPVLLLHGWPQSWRTWREVMRLAARYVHVIAIDLPGIGGSVGEATGGAKRDVAAVVRGLVETMGLRYLTLVGHDAGATVAYAYLRAFLDLRAVVIMDVPVPGVVPWDQLVGSPGAWHFGFHAVQVLPERLVQHRQREYFDHFYDAFALVPAAITDGARAAYVDAYSTDAALSAGFNWYRSFDLDAEHNHQAGRDAGPVSTPLLCLLSGPMGPYAGTFADGFHAAGVSSVEHAVLPEAGHFLPEEAPEGAWAAIAGFLGM